MLLFRLQIAIGSSDVKDDFKLSSLFGRFSLVGNIFCLDFEVWKNWAESDIDINFEVCIQHPVHSSGFSLSFRLFASPSKVLQQSNMCASYVRRRSPTKVSVQSPRPKETDRSVNFSAKESAVVFARTKYSNRHFRSRESIGQASRFGLRVWVDYRRAGTLSQVSHSARPLRDDFANIHSTDATLTPVLVIIQLCWKQKARPYFRNGYKWRGITR